MHHENDVTLREFIETAQENPRKTLALMIAGVLLVGGLYSFALFMLAM